MIRYSVESDLGDIITLWREAFGDSESEIKFFLKNHYTPDNTLIYEADGKVASMFFLIEGKMQIKGKLYPAYYLYAACTLNEYRGRGYMTCLLDFAKETAINRGYYFICLLPGEKSLYDYYEKFGYKAVFKNKHLKLSPDEYNSISALSNEDGCNIEYLRNKAFENYDYFKWDKSAVDFAFMFNQLYGGQAVSCSKGYALYSQNNRTLSVKEYAFTDNSEPLYLPDSLLCNDFDEIIVNLPSEYKTTIGNSEIINHGMMLAVNSEAEMIMSQINNAYLGLTLD